MKLTNRYNAPAPLARLLERDPYDNGGADASVTDLIGSPRISVLKRTFKDELTVDISDRIWALFGTAVHHLIEMGEAVEDHLQEERLFMQVAGWLISGGIDLQHLLDGTVAVWDWKVTTCAKVMLGDKDEWERQLNIYAYLIEALKGLTVSELNICALLRDWRRTDMLRTKEYPRSPIFTTKLRLWSFQERERYVIERVAVHQNARREYDLEGVLPLCTGEEMWARGEAWAVTKKGNKRPTKVYGDENMALSHVGASTDQWAIEHRPAQRVRCEAYCEVADFCSQWAEFKGESKDDGGDEI